MSEIVSITKDNANDVIDQLQAAFYDIPFENSKFQTEAFVVAAQITPERAYRAIGLRMMAKLRALNEAKFNRMKQQVDIDEIDWKLQNSAIDQFERRRLEIKREEVLSGNYWTDKLINDAVQELNILYGHFKTLPKYTREQFENAERLHFEQKLSRQAHGIAGASESLVNMNQDMAALEMYEKEVERLGLTQAEAIALEDLRNSMPNIARQQIPNGQQKQL